MKVKDKIAVKDSSVVSTTTQEIVVERKKKPAYQIKDATFGTFDIFIANEAGKGPRPWWTEKSKVEKLITAFKGDLPVSAALVYAGISKTQYFDFRAANPEWDEIKERLEQVQLIGFMNVINTEGKKDLHTARWYAERRHPKFAAKARPETEEPLQPTINVAIGANVDAGIIQTTIREIAREIFASRRGEGSDNGSTPADMAGEVQ
jgi:hypothetical protein